MRRIIISAILAVVSVLLIALGIGYDLSILEASALVGIFYAGIGVVLYD